MQNTRADLTSEETPEKAIYKALVTEDFDHANIDYRCATIKSRSSLLLAESTEQIIREKPNSKKELPFFEQLLRL